MRRGLSLTLAALMLLDIVAVVIWPSWQDAVGLPLLAIMFAVIARHARRRLAADRERELLHEQNARLLDAQRRFLQDAPHHLRAPLTVALTRAEQLAQDLSGLELHDIQMVADEIRRLDERLHVIVARSGEPAGGS